MNYPHKTRDGKKSVLYYQALHNKATIHQVTTILAMPKNVLVTWWIVAFLCSEGSNRTDHAGT